MKEKHSEIDLFFHLILELQGFILPPENMGNSKIQKCWKVTVSQITNFLICVFSCYQPSFICTTSLQFKVFRHIIADPVYILKLSWSGMAPLTHRVLLCSVARVLYTWQKIGLFCGNHYSVGKPHFKFLNIYMYIWHITNVLVSVSWLLQSDNASHVHVCAFLFLPWPILDETTIYNACSQFLFVFMCYCNIF